MSKKPNGYWKDFDNCKTAAAECKSSKEFHDKFSSAWQHSKDLGYWDEITKHFVEVQKPKGYWTKEKCHEAALTCKTKGEFRDKYGSAYAKCSDMGWVDDVCGHMDVLALPKGYWTEQKIRDLANSCTTIKEFRGKSDYACNAAKDLDIWEEISSHFVPADRTSKWTRERCAKVAKEFDSKTSLNKKYPSLRDAAIRYGIWDQITDHMEEKQKPSGYWTKERCIEEGKKYSTRVEYERGISSAYNIGREKGWNDEVCKHMVRQQLPNGHWSKDRCHEAALSCKTRSEFRNNHKTAFAASLKGGWYEEIVSHIPFKYSRRGIVNGMKICPRCKFDKELHEFNRSSKTNDGYSSWCRDCVSIHGSISYAKHKEKTNAKNREKYKTDPSFKAKHMVHSQKRRARKKDREAIWADQKMLIAINEFHQHLRADRPEFDWHIDHMIPMAAKRVSGLHTECNLGLMMRVHNYAKGNRPEYHDKKHSFGRVPFVLMHQFWEFVEENNIDTGGKTILDYLNIETILWGW